MARKLSRKGWVRKLDKITSLIVVRRDRKCFTCGSTQNLQCGHLFTRSLYAVRWNLLNCHAQCRGCNFRHEFDATIYNLKFIDKFGLDAYKELYRIAHRPNKLTNKQLQEIYEALEAYQKLNEKEALVTHQQTNQYFKPQI